jgi:2-polyprenyl-3-methyl-5-hydroxy-6-metoxy-1,4-benzoquinol methylase
MKNYNPIIAAFNKLNIIQTKNLIKIASRCRDKKINVLQDKKTKVILNEKFITNENHYKNDRKFSKAELQKYLKLGNEDEKRRKNFFSKYFINKNVLDFGCEFGTFLNKIDCYTKSGVELNIECIKYIKKKFKKIDINNNLEDLVKKKFDTITMFHVLEHMPYQIKILKELKKKLKKKGYLIIEVPSANDLLLSLEDLKSFKSFTFWSEHLVLHTHISLRKVLRVAGFKKIKVMHCQRYNFNNHIGWFLKNKPGGHKWFKNFADKSMLEEYRRFLIRRKKTDTLIAVASN